MINITIDRKRISNNFKATINVSSDKSFTAIEARATKNGSGFGRGVGICLLSDDAVTVNGVVTIGSAVKQYSFDVEACEIITDGDYRISIYVLDEDGNWNDVSSLLTASSQKVYDTYGNQIFVARVPGGTDDVYKSAYGGITIDNFIMEVLS